MATTTILTVSPGDDLYRIAARYYGDASAWTLIARANPTLGGDPLVQAVQTIAVPPYNQGRANSGIFASQ